MERVLVATSPGQDGGGSAQITIRPPGWPYLTTLLVAVIILVLGKMVSTMMWLDSASVVRDVAILVLLGPVFVIQLIPGLTSQVIVLDNQTFSLRRTMFGVSFPAETLSLKGISNLRREPFRWLGVNPYPGSIKFDYSSDLGVYHCLGSRLNEPDAQRVIKPINEYKSKAEAAVR